VQICRGELFACFSSFADYDLRLQRAPLGSGQNNSEQFFPLHFITNIRIHLSQSENRIWYDSTHRCALVF
jgi:hypothetical protein